MRRTRVQKIASQARRYKKLYKQKIMQDRCDKLLKMSIKDRRKVKMSADYNLKSLIRLEYGKAVTMEMLSKTALENGTRKIFIQSPTELYLKNRNNMQ